MPRDLQEVKLEEEAVKRFRERLLAADRQAAPLMALQWAFHCKDEVFLEEGMTLEEPNTMEE
jgi:hypothetical protein